MIARPDADFSNENFMRKIIVISMITLDGEDSPSGVIFANLKRNGDVKTGSF